MRKKFRFSTLTLSIFLLGGVSFAVLGCNKVAEIVNPNPPSASIREIKVTSLPNKTTYFIGEAFNPDGLVVTAYYNNNTSEAVTDYTLSSVSTGTAGTKVVTVTYKRRVATFSISVVEREVSPTAITLSPESIDLTPGKSKQLTLGYVPSNANTNKGVTFTSDSSSVSVDKNGLVTVSESASAGETATITATSTYNSSLTATCTVNVVEQGKDAWTVLIYMCGADLESAYVGTEYEGLATTDIYEILSVRNQPDDVNIVIQTGGASQWSSRYGISNTNLQRWHVDNQQLVLDDTLPDASMGDKDTLQSFLNWGLSTYPAQKTGLILWNHGGAMRGVCYDENHYSDALTNSEVTNAVSGTRTALGITEKLEWIGYDACLMAVQDIAEFNSQNFNYMIASQESESGYGWDYDKWVDDLYAHKDTEVILKEICDTFIADNTWPGYANNQTLSYYDLSKMEAYYDAWEAFAQKAGSAISGYGKKNFNAYLPKYIKSFGTTYMTSADWNSLSDEDKDSSNLHYMSDGYYGPGYYDTGYDYFGTYDAKDFLTRIKSLGAFDSLTTEIDAVLAAFDDLVVYSARGNEAGDSYGLCFFYSVSYYCQVSEYYNFRESNFAFWRQIVNTYGE